jgi:hypothetical protein
MSQGFAGSGLAVFNTGVTLADGAQLDAFNRLRVSSAKTRLSCKFLADNKPGVWDEKLSNATAAWTSGSYVLLTTTTNAGYAVRQTYQRADYEPGKSQRVVFTSLLTPVSGVEKRVGWAVADTSAPYKPTEGVYFKANSSGNMSVVVCLGGFEDEIEQSDWNLDRMDGTGSSGITIDWSKGQIFFFDLQWLALGRIRFGVEIGGMPYYIHEETHANELTAPYIAIPNLPLYYAIHSVSATSSMRQFCCVVESEGGKDDSGRPYSFDTRADVNNGAPAGTPVSFNDSSLHAVLIMRIRSGRSHAIVSSSVLGFDIICTSTASTNYKWCLVRNPTVAGTALTYTQASDAVEVAKCSNDNTVTIPMLTAPYKAAMIASGYGSADLSLAQLSIADFRLGVGIDGTSDTLALCVERLSNQSETFYGSFRWSEVE